MSAQRFHRRLMPGLVLHGNRLWVSELWAIVLASATIVALLVLGVRIVSNAYALEESAHTIAQLERQDLDIRYRAERAREQLRLLNSLREFIGHRLPPERLCLLTHLVYNNSQTFGYDPLLVLAVIRVESYFDPAARGMFRSGRESGALGLMQVKYGTAELVAAELGIPLEGPEDLFKPEINLPLGIAYLTKQIRYFRSFKLGLLAYNQGPGTIIQNLKHNQPLSTSYYQKVLKAYYKFRRIADELGERGNE